MDKSQIELHLVLDELGIECSAATFQQRLIVQKAVYLAQAAGVHLGYYFNWYLRGPYSPAVANDLFSALEGPRAASLLSRWVLDADTQKLLDSIKQCLLPPDEFDCDQSSEENRRAYWLELLASLHFLVSRRQVDSFDTSTLAERLQKLGKPYSSSQVEVARSYLDKCNIIDA